MTKPPPFEAHLFVCTHRRDTGASCAGRGSEELRRNLKSAAKDPSRGWRGRVRVNASGCLDQCERGIAAVLYPQGRWFLDLKPDDEKFLIEAVDQALQGQ
jgi:(2Fe-2S) ferredoxin